ncbi:MAG: putative hydrogenase subunit [Candidatus Ozemobacter sibiricus]|jgi:Ni,Fe-hydrogenase III large subunit|uniref:Putative hydrogenase subunit n=1 Tax=Candidatus Ozemobacter sibiricus TaxID=2268124 RepID=A0A367ZN85_9BACT|nr:MAG: putative hydrogenase subunit [Candidatus Ozemobacter sibiricus]
MIGARVINGGAVSVRDMPVLSMEAFRAVVIGAVRDGARLSALFGYPLAPDGVAKAGRGGEARGERPAARVTGAEAGAEVGTKGADGAGGNVPVRLVAVLAWPYAGGCEVLATDPGEAYPALTPECPPAHWFEREIAEQWAIRPEGHPWLKPIRYHRAWRPGDAWGRPPDAEILPCVTDFLRVEGDEVHEVAVGPVHAGVIEPGHFRFQCHGEQVFHLEIALGYQHRGVERALVGGPDARTIHLIETLAGDTTIGHALAYAQLVEGMTGTKVPARALAIRALALELERLANHVGDLGALANDVGFLPTASYCGRLRGDFLNLSALVCGSRFGRGLVRPGGVRFDLEPARQDSLKSRFEPIARDVENAVTLLWQSSSVLARFEETGRVARETALALGLVGPAARASGVERDVRMDFPTGYYRFLQVPVAQWTSGDVFARAFVRWLEIQRSEAFIRQVLAGLPEGPCQAERPPGTSSEPVLPPHRLGVSLVEGWRGEICHVALTDVAGKFQWYKVVDPSFHNWMGLAMALRDQPISDFPLCNKSFNLSYCGHDL